MGPFPSFTPLFVFAIIGMVLSAILALSVLGWAGYHLVRALMLYAGGAA